MSKDEMLRMQIREALDHDQRIPALSVAVTTRFGIVTLNGCAPSASGILAAIEIVSSFPGCRGVINRQVLGRRCAATPDARLAAPGW